jgi:hypothetical protein
MEQGGQKVAEIQDHGLTATPSSPLNSLADVPIERNSNNLGFYNQTFSVVAPAADAAPVPKGSPGELVIDGVDVSPASPVLLDQPVTLRVRHHARNTHFDSVLVLFSDGDPEQGGRLFDMELIPRILANETFVTPVPFRPRACGAHELLIQAIPTDGTAAPVTAQTTVDVTVDPIASTEALIATIQEQALPQGLEKSLLAKLQAAERAFAKGDTEAGINQLNAYINYVGRLVLFVAVWFAHYLSNYGWVTLALTLLVEKGYSLVHSFSFMLITGICFAVGAVAAAFVSDRLERRASGVMISLIWAGALAAIGGIASGKVIVIGGFVASSAIGLGLCRGVLCHGAQRADHRRAAALRCTDHRSCPRAHRPPDRYGWHVV